MGLLADAPLVPGLDELAPVAESDEMPYVWF